MDKEQFIAHLDQAFDRLEKKQKALQEGYRLGEYEDFALDLENRRMVFSAPDGRTLAFDIMVIGSFAPEAGSFLWGWADGTLTPEVRENAEKLKGLTVVTGMDLFSQDRLESDENMSVELAVLSVDLTGALGLYRVPGDSFQRYLGLMEVVG